MSEGIQTTLFDHFMESEQFTVKEATDVIKNIKNKKVNNESIRARIYEGVDKGIFKKISRGVYKVQSQIDNEMRECLLINGDGRDLSNINDSSIDGIITDHPYLLKEQLKGGNRNFATYELFRYEQKDFDEKFRVLKEGSFLVEFLPEENATNFDYLYEIKKMAEKSGFKYYSKVPWKKGDFVANTGRKSKNTEDIIFFTKGEPRKLKLDTKKNIATAKNFGLNVKGKNSYEIRDILIENGLDISYMKGTSAMLPTTFDVQPKPKKEKIMEAEKPIALIEQIITYISQPYEILLDQFAGSGNFILACLKTNRFGIAIEKNENMFNKMKNNIKANTTNITIINKIAKTTSLTGGYSDSTALALSTV